MRKINRAIKIRIYLNKEQIIQIEKTIGCCRFLYNQMLAEKYDAVCVEDLNLKGIACFFY